MHGPVALTKDVCVVGRDGSVHLPLRSRLVSKVHALIVRDRHCVFHFSSNGSFKDMLMNSNGLLSFLA